MAAIIAQITRANRERIEKKKFEIVISKCMYEIKPFDRCFDPKKHNKYIAQRKYAVVKEDSEAFYKVVVDRLSELNEEYEKSKTFSWRTCACEAIILTGSLAFVPLLMFCVYETWPDQIVL